MMKPMEALRMFEGDNQSNSLQELFLQRKKSFLDSLERSVKVICSDQQLSRLFKEKNSSSYVPDRICSVIENCLMDDREDFINESFSKLQNIEACFDSKTLEEIEKLGKKILNMPASSQNNEKIRQACLKRLENQIKKITLQYFPQNNEFINIQYKNQIKKQLVELKNYSTSLISNIEKFENEFQQTIRSVKSKIENKLPKNVKIESNSLFDDTKTIQTLVQMQNYSKSRDQEKEAEIEQLKKSLRESKSQIEELIEENSLLKTNLNKTLENSKKIRTTINIMKNSNLSLNLDDSDNDSENDDFAEYIKQLKNENELAKTDIKNLKSQNEQLLAENLDFREQSIRMSTSMNRSSQNLEEQSQATDKLISENKKLKQVNSQLLTASKTLQDQNKEILNQLETSKKEKDLLKTQIFQMSRKIKNTETLKKTLQNQVSDLTTLHDLNKSDNDAFKESTAKEMQKLKLTNDTITNENSELKSELELTKARLINNEKDLTKHKQLNKQIKSENESLTKQIQQNEKQIEILTKANNDYETEINQTKTVLEELQTKQKALEKENNDLLQLHEESLNNCAELKDTADALSLLNTQLTNQNTELHSINEQSQLEKQIYNKNRFDLLQDQYNDVLMNLTKLKNENALLNETRNEIKQIKEKNEKISAENNELNQLNQQIRRELKEFELKMIDKDRKISELNSDKAKIESKLKETEDKLDSIKTANNLIGTKADQVLTLVSENEKLQKKFAKSQKELSKVNEINSQLNRSLKKTKSRNLSLRSELETISNENERLLSKSQNYDEVKKKLSQINRSNNEDDLDDVQKVSETIYQLKKENKENAELLKKQTDFLNSLYSKLECETLTEISNKISQLIKFSTIVAAIKKKLNLSENDKIVSKIEELIQKTEKSNENDQLIRRALKIGENSDVYNSILLLRTKAENSEDLINKEKDKNSMLINRLCSLLQIEESKLQFTIQTMLAKGNDDRIFYKQLRNILQISNDNQIFETIQTNLLKLNELEDLIQKVQQVVQFQNSNELIQILQEYKQKSMLIQSFKDLLKIDNDSEIFNSIQSLLALQTKIKQASLNNSDEYSQITDIQDTFNLLKQILTITKLTDKSELPLYLQNLQNSVEETIEILNVNKISEIPQKLNSILQTNSQLSEYKSKLNENSKQMNQMKNMVQSLEMQFNEISNMASQKQKESDQTTIENQSLQMSIEDSQQKISQMTHKLKISQKTIEKLKLLVRKLNQKLQTKTEQIQKVLTYLNIDKVDQIIPTISSIQNQLTILDKLPLTNEQEMNSLTKLQKCIKDISSELISTDINNFAKEIQEIKNENEEFLALKKHLCYCLTLKANESLTNKIDLIMKENGEFQALCDKLCGVLNVPSKSEISPAVDSLMRNLNELKNELKILQTAASANSKQSLLKSIKSLKETVSHVIELYNLNNESEIKLFEQIYGELNVISVSQLKERIDQLLTEESAFNKMQTEFNLKKLDDVLFIIKKGEKFDQIKQILDKNSMNQINSEIQAISDLIEFKESIQKLCQTEDCLKEISEVFEFRDKLTKKLGSDNYLEKIDHLNQIFSLLHSQSITEANDRIAQLNQISENYQNILNEFKVNNDGELKLKLKQIQSELKNSQKTHKLFKTENEEQIQLQIQKLIKNEKKLCKILSLDDPILIQSRVTALIQLNKQLNDLFGTTDILTVSQNLIRILNNLCATLNYEKVTLMMINNSTSQSQQHTFSNNSEFKFNGIDKAVEKLNNDYTSSVSIFSKLLTIILNKENSIQFPLSVEFEQNLLKMITQMKERSQQGQIILSKANSIGYNGENCQEASNYLILNAKKQQELTDQKEIDKIKDSSEKEKQNFDNEKQKLMNNIVELKQKIEQMTNNEENLIRKMKKEKKKRQMTQLNFIKQKELNESLVTILHGQNSLPYSADSHIMRSPFKD